MEVTRRKALILLTSGAALGSADGQINDPGSQLPAGLQEIDQVLQLVLSRLVQFELLARRAALSTDGAGAVVSLVEMGVKKLQTQEQIRDDFAVSIAIDGARRIGDAIYQQARRAGGDMERIGETVVQAAHKAVCPLYPFC